MTFTFSHSSTTHLLTCHPDLQEVARAALLTSPVDFAVVCGHRNKFDQDKCCAEGKSNAPWPTSKHNFTPSRAMDIVPIKAGKPAWDDIEAFRDVADAILTAGDRLGIRLRWGGTWTDDADDALAKFRDAPHIEMVG
jgi:peptidoglycan L-alanyl-D-glutamate endopeptidase CwlK